MSEHPIRTWRRERKMSQAAFSGRIGCKPSHLSLVETGHVGISAGLALKVAEVTSISLEALLRWEVKEFLGRRPKVGQGAG